MVHVVLCAFLCGVGDRLSSLTLGTNEKNAAAFGDGITDNLQSLIQHWNSLCKVHDVDAVTRAVNERTHTWVPALCLVTKVYACFKQLAHGELRKSHVFIPFRFCLVGGLDPGMGPTGGRSRISPSKAQPRLRV